MNTIEVIALSAVGCWLLVVSVVLLMVIRQMSLMTVRLSTAAPHSVVDEHGPRVGTPVPAEVNDLLGPFPGPLVLAFATGTCDPCREFAEGLARSEEYSGLKFLILGDTDQTTEIVGALPAQVEVVPDPASVRIANLLGVDLMPFAVRIANGMIEETTHLRDNEDLARIRSRDDLSETIAEELEVVSAGKER